MKCESHHTIVMLHYNDSLQQFIWIEGCGFIVVLLDALLLVSCPPPPESVGIGTYFSNCPNTQPLHPPPGLN